MGTFSRSPRLLKGAIVGFDLLNPLASVILFQYNPNTLTRSLKAKAAEKGSAAETLRLAGAPDETIKVEIEIDATDALERGGTTADSLGIYPQLAALEMLVYPKSLQVITNTILAAIGTIELIPPSAPFTLFIWGIKRVLPVRISEFSITEEAFDPDLNPIRASVSLSMNVLSYNDFKITHPGHYVYLANHIVKEVMATIASVNNIAAVAGGDVKLF